MKLPLPIRHLPYITKLTIEKHQIFLETLDKEKFLFILEYLKKHSLTRCLNFIDMTCVDYPTRKNRFELIYIVQSLQENIKVIIKNSTNEITAVNSLTGLYRGACWAEREIWDMFGVFFKDSPDLRRILTDYGFNGYPLRKEFPLSGYLEVFYNDRQKRVITKKIELSQEFRSFDLRTPWAG